MKQGKMIGIVLQDPVQMGYETVLAAPTRVLARAVSDDLAYVRFAGLLLEGPFNVSTKP